MTDTKALQHVEDDGKRDNESGEESDDEVKLSAFALSALQEFVSEQQEREKRREEAAGRLAGDPEQEFEEDWVNTWGRLAGPQ